MDPAKAEEQNSSGRGTSRNDTSWRDGCWTCSQCGNMNFRLSTVCNRCGAARPAAIPRMGSTPVRSVYELPLPLHGPPLPPGLPGGYGGPLSFSGLRYDYGPRSFYHPYGLPSPYGSPWPTQGMGYGPVTYLDSYGYPSIGSSLPRMGSTPVCSVYGGLPGGYGGPFSFSGLRYDYGPGSFYRPYGLPSPYGPPWPTQGMGNGTVPYLDTYRYPFIGSSLPVPSSSPSRDLRNNNDLHDDNGSENRHGASIAGSHIIYEGDWICPNCNHVNYSLRTTCSARRCETPRPVVPVSNSRSSGDVVRPASGDHGGPGVAPEGS